MTYLFYTLILIFIGINLLKILCTILYIKSNIIKSVEFDDSKFSIVQPIMSGDDTLESNLRFNLDNTKNAHFVWLLDDDDIKAQELCNKIKESYHEKCIDIVVVEDIPNNCNRKTYKMCKSLAYAKEYFVALDDDTKITYEKLSQTITLLNSDDKMFVTAYPYYKSSVGLFSQLVTSFVNANSLFLYLGVSYISPLKMLSGMFYVTKTKNLNELNAYENILYFLSDELALANLAIDRGYNIKLLPISFQITTTVPNIKQYFDLMKKWIVFFNHYMKKDLSPKVVLMALFPALLPVILLILSISLSKKFLALFIFVHIFKTIMNMIVRIKVLNLKENFASLILEPIADYMQVFHIMNASIFPNDIIWRGKKIKLINNQIHVEN